MSNAFAKEALKICVAQICQNIGWHAVQSSPMEILVDVIHRYLLELSKSVHGYSTQYNRTIPNLDDLGLAFKDFGINVSDIEEYVNNVEPVPFVQKVASFPVKHPSNLQHPKPDSRELSLRPEHIPEYLPLMHPELEEEDGHFSSHSSADGVKKNVGDSNNIGGDSPSPISSPKHGIKRPGDWASEIPSKKPRYYSEEEGRPMREVTSVFMSPAGFISPVHEGKTADSSLPCLVDSPPSSPEPPPHSFTPVIPKKESKSKDIKKEKSSKSKKDKEINKKDSKKLKTSKREKENKENSGRKTEKVSSSSPSVKKEHSSSHRSSGKSEKSSRSDDSFRSKSKSERSKMKARKGDMHKIKDFKLSKSKSKLKHAMLSSSSLKSPKLSSSKKFKSIKSPRLRSPKSSISKITYSEPPLAVAPIVIPKVETEERKVMPIEIEEERPEIKIEEPLIIDEIDFREESPEPERLVIDDSIETQVRQEKESRLAIVDRCIEAVIKRGEEESEVESEKYQKALDETINDVVRGPTTMMNMRKLEPKDIYDFTDTSDSSSLSSSDIPPHSPVCSPVKKEKKSSESKNKKSEHPKKNKQRKRGTKEPKARSPTDFSSPKNKFSSSNFVLKVEDRTPSPSDLKDDLLSSDDSSPFPSPSPNSVFDGATPPNDHLLTPPPFVPLSGSASSYSSSPFAPIRPMPCHLQANPHFPTPPLFVTPSKTESSTSFQSAQPLNLAKSTPKVSPESKVFESNILSSQSLKIDVSSDSKKSSNLIEKAKLKDHKKDKIDKKEKLKKRGRDKKESERVKEKKEKEDAKEKIKIKEKSKSKPEKVVKVDRRKTKLDKKKGKEKEEKFKEDTTVPKMTLKLSTGSCSTKIFIKSSSKNSSAGPSSPITSDIEMPPTPSPPPHVPTPSPPRVATPPPPREPTPSPPPAPPAAPSPPLPEPELEEESPPLPPPPVTKPTPSRGRGRGRKAAVPQALPPARTVITETLGTIVDESGNKIWICPACSRADDGSPMIGCDGCDDWYHWICVGIVVPPKEEENWFCSRCVSKRQGSTVKRRRKKHRKDK